MNSRRTVIIGAAIMLALVAFLGNVLYLKNVKDEAYGNATLVKVYVVKKAIPKGTRGEQAISQDYVRAGQIPAEYRPGSALSNIDDIKGKVAINALSAGQVVVDGQFVDQNVAQVTFAQQVPARQTAITVSVDQIHGVAGLLVPGDKVNLMVVSNGEGESAVQTLYQNVNIIAIGAKTAPQAGEDTSASSKSGAAANADNGLITFAVPLEAAQKLAFVASGLEEKALYLTLVPPDSQPVTPAPAATNNGNLFGGPVTPYDK